MDDITTKRLERLRRFHTRYEVVMKTDDEYLLVGYTARKSFNGLASLITEDKRFDAIVAVTGAKNGEKVTSKLVRFGCWDIFFSGRTQRDAIIQGEPDFVMDVADRSTANL